MSVSNIVSNVSEPLPVTHYSFTGDVWPMGALIPNDKNLLLQFHRIMSNATGQILIHCADGCSRSSLLVVMLQMVDMMKVESIVHVPLACRHAIYARPQAINNIEQYKYLYELALEYIEEQKIQEATTYTSLTNSHSSPYALLRQ